MAAALRALGVGVADDGADWVVTPAPLRGGGSVDVGLAGTVQRFVPPVAALADGAGALRRRPAGPAPPAGPAGRGPARSSAPRSTTSTRPAADRARHAAGSSGGTAEIDASASSQFVSGAAAGRAPVRRGPGAAAHRRRPVPSALHIRMTVQMLRDAGADVDDADPDGRGGRSPPGRCAAARSRCAPDLSSAAPFVAAAVATGGRVRGAGLAAAARPARRAAARAAAGDGRPRRGRRRRADRDRRRPAGRPGRRPVRLHRADAGRWSRWRALADTRVDVLRDRAHARAGDRPAARRCRPS